MTKRQTKAVADVEGWTTTDDLRAFYAFVERHRLEEALAAIDGDPENCRAFARGYNGTDYERRRYHEKLAAALQ